jgi:prefoldin subunit 5
MTLDVAQLIWLVVFGLSLAAVVSITASVRRLNTRFDHLDSSMAEIEKALKAIRDSMMQAK